MSALSEAVETARGYLLADAGVWQKMADNGPHEAYVVYAQASARLRRVAAHRMGREIAIKADEAEQMRAQSIRNARDRNAAMRERDELRQQMAALIPWAMAGGMPAAELKAAEAAVGGDALPVLHRHEWKRALYTTDRFFCDRCGADVRAPAGNPDEFGCVRVVEVIGADIDPPADGPHEQRLRDQRKPLVGLQHLVPDAVPTDCHGYGHAGCGQCDACRRTRPAAPQAHAQFRMRPAPS